VIDDVLAKLPESVRRTAPDYAAIRRELMRNSPSAQTTVPVEAPRLDERVISEVAPAEPPQPDAPAPAPAAPPAAAPPAQPAPPAEPAPKP
jgi:hypothetical protein